jgi:phosphoglycerate kinase|tara:strand:+ start:572 stop:1759 length:1188 start_codon:yes stop_codon:yes gene_type:complete
MIKTLNAFDLRGKNILIRTDFNVPMDGETVSNNFRIKAVLPTIMTCLDAGAAVVIMSHMGRPKGTIDNDLSLIPVGEELAGLLEMPIKFSDNCISTDSIDTSISLKPGEIHLLENLRFHAGEEANDMEFSSQLARHGQLFINDAFGTAHRSHASNVGVLPYFKNAGIGWLMDKELNYLDRFMSRPKTPLTLILGGAKIDTKLKLIDQFLDKADNIIIGGGMAFTFLKAKGKKVGGSLVDGSMISIAKDIMNKARVKGAKIILPSDALCALSLKDNIQEGPCSIDDIPDNMMGLDIGPDSMRRFNTILGNSKTILWNGPMGVFESKGFESGTREMAIHLVSCVTSGSKVIVGGGDTAAALEQFGLMNEMTHVSTGGGASLELLSGNSLPAITALRK